MTTKRTHGPCTCTRYHQTAGHESDCPSLYPAQQEPDALTRLVRHIRQAHDIIPAQQGRWREEALSLISEAREEQKRALANLRDVAADAAYATVLLVYGDAVRAKQVADAVMKDSEP